MYYILFYNKMKKKYYTVGTVPKSNIKIVESDKVDTPNTQIPYCSEKVPLFLPPV
jgi:hypothetical protein